MNIKKYFEFTPTIDLTAAHIGINKWIWKSIEDTDIEAASKTMIKYRYDVLPIKNHKGGYDSYFSTKNWNDFSEIEIADIQQNDTIYYRISFEDLIEKFYTENRIYYFLSNHREILGMVSIVNLNSQSVYSFLFQLVSSIEKTLSQSLEHQVSQDDIITAFKNSTDKINRDIFESFVKSKDKGKDNSIFQHMYLQNIGYILKKFQKRLNGNLIEIQPFRDKFSPDGLYNNIRNTVMHPVKPVINDSVSLAGLNEFLNDYRFISEILSNE